MARGGDLYEQAMQHEQLMRPVYAEIREAQRGMGFMHDVPGATKAYSKTGAFAERATRQNDTIQPHLQLLQTDNDVTPVMGAVHLVRADANFSQKHFMMDVEGDANEGRRKIIQKGRRGPFGSSFGPSTVMDSSAHVKYRNRRGVMEITVRKGVTAYEIQLLVSKLRSHKFGTEAYITLIKGKKRYRLGPLREFSLERLEDLVRECLMSYSSCGLEVTGIAGDGSLFQPGSHSVHFKNRVKRGVGLFR